MTISIYDCNTSAHLRRYVTHLKKFNNNTVNVEIPDNLNKYHTLNNFFGLLKFFMKKSGTDTKLVFSTEYLFHLVVMLLPIFVISNQRTYFIFIKPPYLDRPVKRLFFLLFTFFLKNQSYILYLSRSEDCNEFKLFPELADFENSNRKIFQILPESVVVDKISGFGVIDDRKKLHEFTQLQDWNISLCWIGGDIEGHSPPSFSRVEHKNNLNDNLFLEFWNSADFVWSDQRHNYSSATVYRAALGGKYQVFCSDSSYLDYLSTKLTVERKVEFCDGKYVAVLFSRPELQLVSDKALINLEGLLNEQV